MPGNKPLTREEFRAYMKERDRKHKAYDTAERTVKVMYKSLCPACEYNATHGKKIIYNCPNCKVRYWNNCSKNQVKNGGILSALQSKYGNIEWVKAYNPDGTLYYEWRQLQDCNLKSKRLIKNIALWLKLASHRTRSQ